MKDSIDHSDAAPAAIADERASMAFVALDRPRKPKPMNALTLRLPVLFTLAIAASAAHGQILLSTGFEAPTYTAGASALGVYGWNYGTKGGSAQKVTNARASVGAQSLLFDNSGTDVSSNSLMNSLAFGTSGKFTFTSDVWTGGNNGAGRIAGVRLNSTGSVLYNETLLSIDGSGAVRVGPVAYYDDNLGITQGYALEGSFAQRWLKFSLSYDPANGKTDWRVGGFGSGQADFSGSYVHSLGSSAYIQVESTANPASSARNGSVYFDNLRVAGPDPVPEPASMAVLGLGAVGVVARRRRR